MTKSEALAAIEDAAYALFSAASFTRNIGRVLGHSPEIALLLTIYQEHLDALKEAHDTLERAVQPFSAPSPVFTSAPPAELDAPPTCDCDPDRAWKEREER